MHEVTMKFKTVVFVLLCCLVSFGCLGQEFEITNIIPSATSIQVTWTYPAANESTIIIFSITATYLGPCTDAVQPGMNSANPPQRVQTVGSLEEFSQYSVVVAARPRPGPGVTVATTAMTILTLPSAPSSGPTALRLASESITFTSIAIQWDPVPCLQQNSMITAYGVTVRDVNSTLVSSHQQDVDMTSYSETGLHSDREYSFEVYAIGNSDSGNLHSPSVRIMATTAEELDPDVTSEGNSVTSIISIETTNLATSGEEGVTEEMAMTEGEMTDQRMLATTGVRSTISQGHSTEDSTIMTDTQQEPALSTGLIVAIVVCSVLIIVTLNTLFLLLLCCLKRRKAGAQRREFHPKPGKRSSLALLISGVSVDGMFMTREVSIDDPIPEDMETTDMGRVVERPAERMRQATIFEDPSAGIVMSEGYYNRLCCSAEDYDELLNEVAGGKNITGEVCFLPGQDEDTLLSQLKEQGVRNISHTKIKVIYDEQLGAGKFGPVYLAEWSRDQQMEKLVTVKTLTDGATAAERVLFLQEAAILAQFRHPNLVALYGVSHRDQNMMTVVEYMANGVLKQHLKLLKPSPNDFISPHLSKLLLEFCQQICLGMQYLAQKGFVLRSLCSKGILVSENNMCKISDVSMSHDLCGDDSYTTEQPLPAGSAGLSGWLAQESIVEGRYSTASDVWSYGCVLYEIWSLGLEPHENKNSQQVIQEIQEGFRLPPPPGCPRKLYKIMIQCWAPLPQDRPDFRRLLIQLVDNKSHILSHDKSHKLPHPQARRLGAPLDSAEDLYPELQRQYLNS